MCVKNFIYIGKLYFGVKLYMSVSVLRKSNTQVQYPSIKKDEIQIKEESKPVKNTLANQLRTSYQKTTSAFTEYPAKGLKGSKKATFYEFLTMGAVPYLVGSATFMALFAGVNKKFDLFAAKSAGPKKLALGVVLFGVAKSLSKHLISTPVKIATGIDTEEKYEKHTYTPDKTLPPEYQIDEYEQHKVMESHDFPRYDLLYGEKHKDKDGNPLPHNYFYDKIAKKNGLGENLPASDTEVKPIIKDVISRSNTAKSISSYLWAAVGVTLAAQDSWSNFFRATSKANWEKFKPAADSNIIKNIAGRGINTAKNIGRIAGSFGRNFVNATKELYHGPEGAKGFNKNAGKFILGAAILSSVLGAANTIYGAKHAVGQNKNVFDKKEKVTVQ